LISDVLKQLLDNIIIKEKDSLVGDVENIISTVDCEHMQALTDQARENAV
jgi:hypothetical protein